MRAIVYVDTEPGAFVSNGDFSAFGHAVDGVISGFHRAVDISVCATI